MQNSRIIACVCFFLAIFTLTSCGNAAEKTEIEMELTENYSNQDPFIHEKLFYVSDDVDTLQLDVAFEMDGESGILEIADNETEDVLWSDTWNGTVNRTIFPISLSTLDKEKEYVIKFTGTKIKYAKIVATSENNLMKERERPLKKQKEKKEKE